MAYPHFWMWEMLGWYLSLRKVCSLRFDLSGERCEHDTVWSMPDLPGADQYPLVVSFYTTDPDYTNEVSGLIRSVDRRGLDSDIRGVPPFPSWEEAVHYKPTFIREMRLEHPDRALLWTDADSVIRRPLDHTIGFSADVSCRVQDFPYRKAEWLASTVLFNPTSRSDELLERWIALNAATPATRSDPMTLDQANLMRAVQDMGDRIKWELLPAEYCFLPQMRDIYPDADPVIVHFQASRRFYTRARMRQK
jgi:hypothetical protein